MHALRLDLFLGLTFVISVPALGQSTLQARPTPGATRDAGTYHVATGTWSRGGSAANISPDAVYRNDAPSGYFGTGWEGCWSIDEIVLPGSDHPRNGTVDGYTVDGFDFSYCKNGAGSVDWTFGWFPGYVPCDDPTDPDGCIDEVPVGISVAGLPGGSACWVVTLDLAGGYEVCIPADGGCCVPGYQGGGLGLDHAGLGVGWITSDGGTAGPLLNGDPTWHPMGDGTCYTPTFSNACGSPFATGLGAQDLFSITDYDFGGTGTFNACVLGNGCYFFGGYTNNNGCGSSSGVPLGQFGMVLYASCNTECDVSKPWGTYCDETQNPNNAADISITSTTLGGPISVELSNAPPSQFAYLLIGAADGTVSLPPGAKGDLCVVGGFIGRYDQDVFQIDAGGDGSTDLRDSATGGANYGIPNGGGHIQPGDIWYFQYWHRQPMGQPASFSSALWAAFQ